MTPLFRKFIGLHWFMIINMLGLLVFGVTAIYSAGHLRSEEFSAAWNSQINWIAIGLVGFFAASLIDYRWVRWGAVLMYLAGLGGLIALKFYAVEIYGERNWLRIGGFQVQPSQPALAAGILMMAVVMADLPRLHKMFRYHWVRLLVSGLVAAVPMALVIKEDQGSGMVWAPVLATIWLVGLIPFRYLISITLVGVTLLPVVYFLGLQNHQRVRIENILKVWSGEPIDTLGSGYDLHYVQMAIGSGGWSGKGFLANKVPGQRSINRMGFIPDTAINDYIFPVVAEEQGFRGAALFISALALLLLQAVLVAFAARDLLGRLIVVGVVAMFFMHIFWNIGMSLALVPIAGIPIPLVSYGGTFMVVTLFLLGMIQSVWVHRNIQPVKKKAPEPEETWKREAPRDPAFA